MDNKATMELAVQEYEAGASLEPEPVDRTMNGWSNDQVVDHLRRLVVDDPDRIPFPPETVTALASRIAALSTLAENRLQAASHEVENRRAVERRLVATRIALRAAVELLRPMTRLLGIAASERGKVPITVLGTTPEAAEAMVAMFDAAN